MTPTFNVSPLDLNPPPDVVFVPAFALLFDPPLPQLERASTDALAKPILPAQLMKSRRE